MSSPTPVTSWIHTQPCTIWHGDNLELLRMGPETSYGPVKLAYLDPPYNTGRELEHYADRRASADWLSFMRERLVALRAWMRPDGFVVAQIDDKEHAYLQVLMDEVFGRSNRLHTVVVKMAEVSGLKLSHADSRLMKTKEYVLIYRMGPDARLTPERQLKPEAQLHRYLRYYTKVIEDPSAPVEAWRIVPIRKVLEGLGRPVDEATMRAFQLEHADRVVYRTNNKLLAGMTFDTPTAEVISPQGRRYIWWEGRQMLFLSDHIHEAQSDLWTDISTINLNKEGGVAFRNGKKPERLLARILELTTAPGDLVLDPFAGSGSTGAVAAKLGRSWWLMEKGRQATTHIRTRLDRLFDGDEVGGLPYEVDRLVGADYRFLTPHVAEEAP